MKFECLQMKIGTPSGAGVFVQLKIFQVLVNSLLKRSTILWNCGREQFTGVVAGPGRPDLQA